jgi:hypothetical protein
MKRKREPAVVESEASPLAEEGTAKKKRKVQITQGWVDRVEPPGSGRIEYSDTVSRAWHCASRRRERNLGVFSTTMPTSLNA